MFGHLSEQRLLDLVEGRVDAAAERHVGECVHCRARLEDAREGLAASQQADVPEPSSLFWESFRRQVGRRIEAEPAPRRPGLVPAFAALAAALALAFGVLVRAPQPPSAANVPVLPAWSPLPAGADDVGTLVIGALAPTEEELAAAAPCRGLECLEGWSVDETQAVAEALRVELGGRTL